MKDFDVLRVLDICSKTHMQVTFCEAAFLNNSSNSQQALKSKIKCNSI